MRSDDRRKHKLSGFILCGLWISIPQFLTIQPTVEICQYGQKWWTYLSDIIIPTAIILMWLKSKDISIAVIVFFGREILYQNVFNIKTTYQLVLLVYCTLLDLRKDLLRTALATDSGFL